MALRGDTYGTVAEVVMLTRHLLRGTGTFNSTTRPTITEVESVMDRVSGSLNVALRQAGLTTPVTAVMSSTAVLSLDGFAVETTVKYVEATLRSGSVSRRGGGSTPAGIMSNLGKKAKTFVDNNALGLKRLGVTEANRAADGLSFTGETIQKDRADPDDTTIEQPKFKRGMFDN